MALETKNELDINHHNIITVEPLKTYHIGTFQVTPFDLQHDVYNLGYLMYSTHLKESAIYITDSAYCRYKFKDINYFIIECNYVKEILDEKVRTKEVNTDLRNRIVKTHMSLETLKELLKANGVDSVKEIYLTHLSNSNSDYYRIKNEIEELTGKVVNICEAN